MSKPPISLFAVILLALAGLVTVNSTAQAARTSCLPGSVKAKLAQIRAKFGPVRIVSTHRPGARIAGSGKRSYHASCRAVDFHAPRGKRGSVGAWLKRNHSGGVGTYSCRMHHIHIDNGPRVSFHHCVNARGRPVGKNARTLKDAPARRTQKHPRGAVTPRTAPAATAIAMPQNPPRRGTRPNVAASSTPNVPPRRSQHVPATPKMVVGNSTNTHDRQICSNPERAVTTARSRSD